MSHPNPTYDPSDPVYPDDFVDTTEVKEIKNLVDDGQETVCPDCEGAGYTIRPAHQYGGEIIDEVEVACHCTKH